MNFENVECLPMLFYQYQAKNSAAIELFQLLAQIISSQCFVMITKKVKEQFLRNHEKRTKIIDIKYNLEVCVFGKDNSQ